MKYIVLATLLLASGCSTPESHSDATANDLLSIVSYYDLYNAEQEMPPKSAEMLADFADPFNMTPGDDSGEIKRRALLAKDDYVVYWGYDLSSDREQNSSVVLAYHKDVPTQGGYVVFGDGSVRILSKSKFASARKAEEFILEDVASEASDAEMGEAEELPGEVEEEAAASREGAY